ncbi:hypothetical protein [Alkalinema sp. FACHB-956]|uniref:hypothetical protein n=1 Tax=Alkalinema sp. FACHB-956 TaxID=2692768 RepID=UPI001687F246|nr:hypothetical protein [Alkalinema sp. FACHB-956]MBD2326187.1 hypothetical protein [Alkalinema sp. FACHB-956]
MLGVITLAAGSALADNASVSGSVSFTTPAGYTTSFSAEKVAPTGYGFNGAVTVTAIPGAADGTPSGMTLDSTMSTVVANSTAGATLKENVLTKLGGLDVSTKSGLDAYTAIVKAAAGTDGLE